MERRGILEAGPWRQVREVRNQFAHEYPDDHAEKAANRSVCREHLPSNANWSLRIFGSCLDERASGGDVDLYLEIEGLDATERAAVVQELRPALEDALERPVDLVVQDPARPLKAVAEVAREQGVSIAGNTYSEENSARTIA